MKLVCLGDGLLPIYSALYTVYMFFQSEKRLLSMDDSTLYEVFFFNINFELFSARLLLYSFHSFIYLI